MGFGTTQREVLKQRLTGLRIKPVKGLRGKRAQHQLRLIEPRGRGRGVEHAQARPAGEVAVGLLCDRGAPVVPNEVNAPRFGIAPCDWAPTPQAMVVVVFVQPPPRIVPS